jgi:ubiquinone/menaquinone biosynthesis C-methylase UbiE
MSLGERFFAWNYDRFVRKTEKASFAPRRAQLLPHLEGEVLEIGAGTGANLSYYGDGVMSLTMTEPSKPMVRRLQRHAEEVRPGVRVLRAPAEDLPFEDDSFDVAVSTLVLCSVDDQPRALRELHRVLRPGGQLVFMEHVRSEEEKLARLQDRLNWLNNLVAHCDCNRPTLDSMREAGFSVEEVEHGTLEKAPPFVRPLVAGAAAA